MPVKFMEGADVLASWQFPMPFLEKSISRCFRMPDHCAIPAEVL
jgi:hypothetical protein